jgi:hypothetical protein
MKNHLFIGLGGQGGNTIAELKKVFAQRSADAANLSSTGHNWDFLYIDSSKEQFYQASLWSYFGKNYRLDDRSFVDLQAAGQSVDPEMLAQRKDIQPWIGNYARMKAFLNERKKVDGANQRRRFGRLLFAQNANKIRTAICDHKVAPLLLSANQCAFHIFATLAGGTGSGSIVDLVTMIRTEYPDGSVENGFPIYLYLYLTEEDLDAHKAGNFHHNQYASIRDLNALACGAYKPTLVGSHRPGELFSESEPIAQIILSTSLSDRNARIPIAKQHQTIAELTFERIYAFCAGHLDPGSQKALTGQDRLPNYPGEPIASPLRSYHFASAGMRRWEVPDSELRLLLSNDLQVNCLSKLIYQNWSDEGGFQDNGLDWNRTIGSHLLESIERITVAALLEKSVFPNLASRIETELDNAHKGARSDHYKHMTLADLESHLRNHTFVSGSETPDEIVSFRNQRDTRVESVVTLIQEAITQSWADPAMPIGFAYIPEAIERLHASLTSKMQGMKLKLQESDETLQRVMAARATEWSKLTFLSRLFSQRQRDLANAQQRDLGNHLKSRLRLFLTD